MNTLINDSNLNHIGYRVALLLRHDSLISLRSVNHGWKTLLDDPKFWLKKYAKKHSLDYLPEDWTNLYYNLLMKEDTWNSNAKKSLTLCFIKMQAKDSKMFQSPTFQSPLHMASEIGGIDMVWYILQNLTTKLTKDDNGYTPIHKAAAYGHSEIVNVLVNYTDNPNEPKTDGWTPIQIAAKQGHVEVIKKLVNFIQTPPNAPTPKGWTPIQLATGHGHTEVVKYLVNYSDNPIAINPNGWSPIHVAAQKGYLEIVQILSAFTQTPNIPSGNNWTPLQLAAGNGHAEIVQFLAARESMPNAPNPNGLTPIESAATNGYANIVKALINFTRNPNAKNSKGWTPFQLAIQYGHVDVLQALDPFKGNNVISPNPEGKTPIQIAAEEGFDYVLQYLVKNIEEPNAPLLNGWTPFQLGAFYGHVKVLEILMPFTSEPNAKRPDGTTPIQWAASNGKLDVLKFLCAHTANPNAPNSKKFTPLQIAIEKGHAEIVKYLVTIVDQPNERLPNGDRPLHLAATKGYLEIVKILSAYTRDPNEKNPWGNTPIYYAAMKGHSDVINYLAKFTDKPNAPCLDGKTPTYIAKNKGHYEVVKLLEKIQVDINQGKHIINEPPFIKNEIEIIEKQGSSSTNISPNSGKNNEDVFFSCNNCPNVFLKTDDMTKHLKNTHTFYFDNLSHESYPSIVQPLLTVESQCKKCLDDSDVAQCFECGCAICGGKENQEVLLFCELCQFYNHTYCLNPPLENIPEHDFLCPKCGTQCQVCEKFFPDLLNKHLMRKTNRCKNLKEDYRKMVEAAQKTALETKKSLENKNNKGIASKAIDAAAGKRFSKKCRGCQLFFTNISEHLKKPQKSACRSYYKPSELSNLKRKMNETPPEIVKIRPGPIISKAPKIEYEIPEELWKNKLSKVFSKTLGKIFCKICNSTKCDIKLHYKNGTTSTLLKCKVCQSFSKDINLHLMSNPICKNFYQQNPSELPSSTEVSVKKFDDTAEMSMKTTNNTFYQQNNLRVAENPQNYNVMQHMSTEQYDFVNQSGQGSSAIMQTSSINNFGPEVEIVKQFYDNSMENVEIMGENNVENLAAKFDQQQTLEINPSNNDTNHMMQINNIMANNSIIESAEHGSIENETAETLANMEETPKNNAAILCGKCNSNLPGSLYCGDCQSVLCQLCIDEHRVVPITQNHMLYAFVMQ